MGHQKVVLGILDGWGIGPIWGGNAIANSNTPNFTNLWTNFPHTKLMASGKAVGLSGHEMGNSEVGHFTIGAGRIIPQDATRISDSIKDKSFFQNKVLLETINYCKDKNKPLHLMGLLTGSNVHASLDHLFGLLNLLKLTDFRLSVFLHLFTDGRDSPPESALELLEKLTIKMQELKIGKIATLCGRYYAMDRSGHKERVAKALQCISEGKGVRFDSAKKAISDTYRKGMTDEYIDPTNIFENNLPIGLIKKSHAVIFFNFRHDRATEITAQITKQIHRLKFVSFVPYKTYDMPKNAIACFEMPVVKNNLTEVISRNGLSQMHIAESEKFAHVTYFFNGGTDEEFPRARRIKIHSLPLLSFRDSPRMRVDDVAQMTIRATQHKYDFVLFNIANADMMGHIGQSNLVTKAIEAVDENLIKISSACQKNNYVFVLTADHGNAEELIDPKTGEPSSTHSSNPVPFIIVPVSSCPVKKEQIYAGWGLSSIAPTILQLMGIGIPPEMTSPSLIKKFVAPAQSTQSSIPMSGRIQTQTSVQSPTVQKSILQNPSPIINIR